MPVMPPDFTCPAVRCQAAFFEAAVAASLLDAYARQSAAGHITHDAGQESILQHLEDLRTALLNSGRRSGPFGWRPGSGRRSQGPTEPSPRGLYIWGDAGQGKTMLMDMFFDIAPVPRKQRQHFHNFMASVHQAINRWRKERRPNGSDPVAAIADVFAAEASLLCFDEFHVTDIADAMILGRLFETLLARGIVIVATSNVPPELLYENGLNRGLFQPFIQMIRARMNIVRLDAAADFRLRKPRDQSLYFVPADAHAITALNHAFQRLTGVARGEPLTLNVLGRPVFVPEAFANIGRFKYSDLCQRPLGANDFLAIARQFHIVLIDGIPVIDEERRDEAKRFITLIDTFYDHQVKLIVSAHAEPSQLYKGNQGFVSFEFKRTASRLMEMRSAGYFARPCGERVPSGARDHSAIAGT